MVHSSQTDGRIKHVVALVLLMALLACQVSTLSAFPATSSKAAFPSTNNGLIHPVVAFPSSEGNEGKATVASVNKEALVSKKFPRTWVPVASTYEIDPDRPSPVEFLGQNYVCYRDNDGQWVIMDDCCPHRLVPLSEGRINRDNNSLQCSYHGWEFNSQGSCIRIPQATPDVERAALSSAKSCVTSYPSHIEKNVLWFWPWKEDVLSVAGHRSKHPEGLMSSAQVNPSTYSRDLPYGWDSLVENLIDPSHVPFAHHGLQGKREDAIPINMTIPENLGEEGFRFEWQDRTMGMLRSGIGVFQAPYTVAYDAKYEAENPRGFQLSVLCIPTKPGWSRAIILGPSMDNAAMPKHENSSMPDKSLDTTTSQSDSKHDDAQTTSTLVTIEGNMAKKKKPGNSLMRLVYKRIPVWVVHQLSNRFLDSDLAFLHYQERERQRHDSYYMPAASDRCITALRKWVSKYTDVGKEVIPAPLPRSAMFDRWSQHTSQCIHCQKGLKTLGDARRLAHAILALSLIGLKYKVAKLAALMCLGALRAIATLEKSFMEGEFKHYENH